MQELFKRLIPHQCLGAVWSRRGSNKSNGSGGPSSVAATVDQFNAVSYRVISSILVGNGGLGSIPPEQQQQTSHRSHLHLNRAKIVSKWIDIAQVSFFLQQDRFNQQFNKVAPL